jgi:hypothetical protein
MGKLDRPRLEGTHLHAIVASQYSTPKDDPDVVRRARTALILRLANVVDLSTVTEGDDYFDYYVNVPAPEYHELSQRIGNVEFDVNLEFGVWVRMFAIPVGT